MYRFIADGTNLPAGEVLLFSGRVRRLRRPSHSVQHAAQEALLRRPPQHGHLRPLGCPSCKETDYYAFVDSKWWWRTLGFKKTGDRRTEARWIEARGTEARGTEAMGDWTHLIEATVDWGHGKLRPKTEATFLRKKEGLVRGVKPQEDKSGGRKGENTFTEAFQRIPN